MEREYPCGCPYCKLPDGKWVNFGVPTPESRLTFIKCPVCGFAMIKPDGNIDKLISKWNKLTKQLGRNDNE